MHKPETMTLNQSRRGGCLTQLAVALLIVVVVGALIIGGTLFYAYRQGIKYTTDVPPSAPTYTEEEANAQYQSLKPRIDQFFDKTEEADEPGDSQGETPPPTIRLTAADLNALAFRNLKDLPKGAHVSFAISDDRLILNASIPLKGVPLLGGRYFVGTIELSEPPAGYPLPLYLQSANAAGEPLPGALISRFQDPAEARKLLQSNGLGDELGFVRSIRIEPGEIVVELNAREANSE
ncbi:MAG: hypothetical protein DRP71_05350 [Verrucomicrobia bacterium]|nr:MAG: hypothetical protein DRP71_05350 [Verrucomicrobiota bacterium]